MFKIQQVKQTIFVKVTQHSPIWTAPDQPCLGPHCTSFPCREQIKVKNMRHTTHQPQQVIKPPATQHAAGRPQPTTTNNTTSNIINNIMKSYLKANAVALTSKHLVLLTLEPVGVCVYTCNLRWAYLLSMCRYPNSHSKYVI